MKQVLLDIAVTAMLDSCLVAAQAFVLNRLGVPFAAITAFSGIGAYLAAFVLNGIWPPFYVAILMLLVVVACFAYLERLLPQDQYLLLSLAVLGVLRAGAGTSSYLGGQTGISSTSSLLSPQNTLPFAIAAGLLFAAVLLAHALIDRSEFGLAVSVTRIARVDITARPLVPTRKITITCFVIAAAIAMVAGVLRAMYSGRVDPDQFRIQTAVILLMPTLVAGSSPMRIGIFSLAFFMFPEVFGIVIGYDAASLAYIREMALSALVVAIVSRKLLGGAGKRKREALSEKTRGAVR